MPLSLLCTYRPLPRRVGEVFEWRPSRNYLAGSTIGIRNLRKTTLRWVRKQGTEIGSTGVWVRSSYSTNSAARPSATFVRAATAGLGSFGTSRTICTDSVNLLLSKVHSTSTDQNYASTEFLNLIWTLRIKSKRTLMLFGHIQRECYDLRRFSSGSAAFCSFESTPGGATPRRRVDRELALSF